MGRLNTVKLTLWCIIILAILSCMAVFTLYPLVPTTRFFYVLLFGAILINCRHWECLFELKNKWFLAVFIGLFMSVAIISFCLDDPPNSSFFRDLLLTSIFLFLKEEHRYYVFHYFIKILAALLLIGIIEYLISVCFAPTLYLGKVYYADGYVSFYQTLLNYYPVDYWMKVYRFQGFMDEPGRVGTFCAFLLFILDSSRYRKEYAVFLLAGLLSFSFAFYILFFMYIALNLKNLKQVLVIVLVLGVMYALFYEYVNNYIIDRFTGVQKADNRTTAAFDTAFTEFLNSKNLFFGKGLTASYDFVNNSSVKCVLYNLGLWGLGWYIIVFSLLFLQCTKISFKHLVVLLVYWMSFYQRPTYNYLPVTVLFFAYSLPDLYFPKNKKGNVVSEL